MIAGSSDLRRLLRPLGIVAGVSVAGWYLWGIYVLLAVMAIGASYFFYSALRPPRVGAGSDEADEEFVPLTLVPNAPMADVVCSELRAAGISAFYKSASPIGGANPITNPTAHCEIYVRRADADRARRVVPG